MFLFDLRWLLFYLLLILLAAILLAVWLARRGFPAASRLDSDWAALERAPFALLVLRDAQTYCYANAQARRWLDLSATSGTLPQADWTPLLERDRASAAPETAPSSFYSNVPLASGPIVRWWIVPWRDLDVVLMLLNLLPKIFNASSGKR